MTADSSLPDLSIFLADYLNDARDDLQRANRALLALEKNPNEPERLNEIFRAVHTLKSSSAMLDFGSIAHLANLAEDLLDRVRKQDLPLNQYAIDLFLELVDALESLIQRRVGGEGEKEQSLTTAAFEDELNRKVTALESQQLLERQSIVVIDETGRIESMNAAAERLFGYAFSEAVGQPLALLMPEPDKSRQAEYLANYLAGQSPKIIGTSREVLGLRKDGTTVALELSVNDVVLAGRRLFIGLLREMPKRAAKTAGALNVEKTAIIRVHARLLDSLFNLAGELVITKNRIDTLVAGLPNKDLKSALGTMDRLVNELQEDISAARLVAVDEVFQKFPRLVRDVALEENKEIDLVLEGRQIELDKSVLDAISDPILHLLRNAIDHGIEPPQERHAAHKPRRATIRLAAKRTENHILIEVEDDGAGIDAGQVKKIAVAKGLITPEQAELLSQKDAIGLIFSAGFTSTREVTELSGRGVGLDVVKTATERLGGTIAVSTRPGEGSRFTLQLPLATAIIETLMVGVGEHIFAIPCDIVIETFDLKPEDVRGIGKQLALAVRGEVIRFVKMSDLLNIPLIERREEQIAVVVRVGENLIALGVDLLLDQTENIIKPFDPLAQKLKGFSGGTILGDGRVALLLDIPALV